MGDFGIKRNGSGYYDETAYKAIKDVANGVCAGDIWKNGGGNEMLVVAVNGGVCTCLMLDTIAKKESIEVISREIRYTVPYFLQYVFDKNLHEFVKKIRDEEFEAILKAVGEALGIPTVQKDQSALVKQLEAEANDLKGKLDAALVSAEDWKEAHKKAFVSAVEAQDKLAEAEQALRTAKEQAANQGVSDGMPWEKMYHDLLDRILMKGGACV